MKYGLLLMAGVVVGLTWPAPALALVEVKPARPDLRATPVAQAVGQGVAYLRGKQLANGSWESDAISTIRPGGLTSLVLLALLKAGVAPDDKAIQKGLDYLRKEQPAFTCVRALQLLVFVTAGQKQDQERIQRNVDWLLEARVTDGNALLGWTYTQRRQKPDNSNTSYAVSALYAARLAGARIPRGVWKEIRDFYRRTQLKEGGWVYAEHHNNHSYLTMDTAGVCGLMMAELALSKEQGKPQKGGKAKQAPDFSKNKPIQRALKWISGERYAIELQDRVYYNLDGISRLGRVSGQRLLGTHDWYRDGCQFLLKEQARDGSWPRRGVLFDKWPVINTSFALLFLSQGR